MHVHAYSGEYNRFKILFNKKIYEDYFFTLSYCLQYGCANNFKLSQFILSQNLKLHPDVFYSCKKIHAINGLHLDGEQEIFNYSNIEFVNNNNVLKLKEEEYKFIVNRFGFINKNYKPKYYDKLIENIVIKMNSNLELSNILKDESEKYFDSKGTYYSLFSRGLPESFSYSFDITKLSSTNYEMNGYDEFDEPLEYSVGDSIFDNTKIYNFKHYMLFSDKLKYDDLNISYDYYDYFTGDVHCNINNVTDKKLIKCIHHGIMVNPNFAKRLLNYGNKQFKNKCISSIFSRGPLSSLEYFDSNTFITYYSYNFTRSFPISKYCEIVENFKYNFIYNMILRNFKVHDIIVLDIPEYTSYVAACKIGNVHFIKHIEEMYEEVGHFIKILDLENEEYVYEIIHDKPKVDLDFSIINPYNMDFEFSIEDYKFEVLELNPNYLTNMESLTFEDLF